MQTNIAGAGDSGVPCSGWTNAGWLIPVFIGLFCHTWVDEGQQGNWCGRLLRLFIGLGARTILGARRSRSRLEGFSYPQPQARTFAGRPSF